MGNFVVLGSRFQLHFPSDLISDSVASQQSAAVKNGNAKDELPLNRLQRSADADRPLDRTHAD